MVMVKGLEDEDGAGLYWEDGTRLTDKEGEAWWAGYKEGHEDGEEDAEEDMIDEIMRLRNVLRLIAETQPFKDEDGNSNILDVSRALMTTKAAARAALGEGKE
jgi:hypothetical protein